jgi:N-acetyl sugar amidotransferase
MRTCARCIYDETVPGIVFDEKGVCNYCKQHDDMVRQYPEGEKGRELLEELAKKIREAGKGKKHDCVIGVSGGCDSSYMLHLAKEELGLRPVAAHFDNTWNSMTAVQNLHIVLKKLDIELYTYVTDSEEFNSLARSMLLASVPEIDALSDIGLTTTLYMAAQKYKVKYILNGHNFRTEGVNPIGWFYFDGKYIADIHRKFGDGKIRSFPNLWLGKFMRYLLANYKRVRPLYYINYNKEDIKKFLNAKYGWKWYGGHHMENRYTAYNHYLLNTKFDRDFRMVELSAMIRSKKTTKDEALKEMRQPPYYPDEIIDEVKKRLGFTDEEYDRIMKLPVKSHGDYKTYHGTFKALRPFFWLMLKTNRIPRSFYDKYTK